MKILIGGCSLSTGHGLPNSKKQDCWANMLARKLNADMVNLAIAGYDNQGIFLEVLKECTSTHYDLILIQITGLSRVILSPDVHGIVGLHYPKDFMMKRSVAMSDTEYRHFHKIATQLNGNFEHWKRLVSMIVIVQHMINKGHNIKFVNGMMHWTQDFFSCEKSDFSDHLLDVEKLPDEDIQKGREIINMGKNQIDLSCWINPFQSFLSLQIDQASSSDSHPGPLSQNIYCDLILEALK